MLAVRRDGADSDRAQRFRRVGRDLVMSVQPKGSPTLRKKFLMQLPPLMKDLNEGMKLIGWPEAAQKDFFGKLLPAHAESLKGQPLSELDYNLLVKQLEGDLRDRRCRGRRSLRRAASRCRRCADEVIEQRFTPEEAQQVGLVAREPRSTGDEVDESDIDLGEDAAGRAGLGLGRRRARPGATGQLGPSLPTRASRPSRPRGRS